MLGVICKFCLLFSMPLFECYNLNFVQIRTAQPHCGGRRSSAMQRMSSSLLNSLLMIIWYRIAFVSCDTDSCKFAVMNYTYDFSSLQQMGVLNTTDEYNDALLYEFTICGNLTRECNVSPDPGYGSVQQFSDGGCQEWLGTWDNYQEEVYFINESNPAQGIKIFWREGYGEGNVCHGSGSRAQYYETAYYFFCNINTTYRALYAEVDQWDLCQYEIYIETKYACQGNDTTSTTTSMPIQDCKWIANNNQNTLDLSTFNNITVIGQSDTNSNLFYRYSPCRNALKCNDNVMDMIDLYNIQQGECNQYLAIWEDTEHESVNYNANDTSWEFIYTNGESCNGDESIMTIIWKCNRNVTNYHVLKAESLAAPCQNLLEIESSIACT